MCTLYLARGVLELRVFGAWESSWSRILLGWPSRASRSALRLKVPWPPSWCWLPALAHVRRLRRAPQWCVFVCVGVPAQPQGPAAVGWEHGSRDPFMLVHVNAPAGGTMVESQLLSTRNTPLDSQFYGSCAVSSALLVGMLWVGCQ